ncbi:MAG: phosphoribosylformylglycinamidine synthase subunit PurS [Candidatus Symbiobacter sp.]|nr:phosphoribosylformylglycinamidine synthase subunit PurS [Candidatus Symbiobacter sp.]
MKFGIYITLHPGIHDPEAVTSLKALHQMGFTGVTGLAKGRYLEIDLNAATKAEAETELKKMCDKLLANPVMEQVKIEFIS